MFVLENKEIVWDEQKDKTNIKNHGISFQEAAFVFIDPYLVVMCDENHSSLEETRWGSIGIVKNTLLVTVFFTERNNQLRIISAREATQKEKEDYRDNISQIFGY